MSVEFNKKDNEWLNKWNVFMNSYLEDEFSFITKDQDVYGRTINGKKPSVKLDLKGLPDFIGGRIISVRVRLENIDSQPKEEIVGGLVRRQIVEVARLKGLIEYNQIWDRERKWSIDLSVGETLTVRNVVDLDTVAAPDVVIFELKKIDKRRNLITIGPIATERQI